jgi:hypothetical protein
MMILRVASVLVFLFSNATLLDAAEEDGLRALTRVHIIIEDLSVQAKEIGITEENLETQTLVAIKRDIPKMVVTKEALTAVYVRVNGYLLEHGGCVVSLVVEVMRPITILGEDGSPLHSSVGTVWETGALLSGNTIDMPQRVSNTVSEKITKLAALYYKANP